MNSRLRRVLASLFKTPTQPGIQVSDVLSLLIALGATVTQGKGSRIRVRIGMRKLTLHRPHPAKECTRGQVESVRAFLEEIDVTPETV